MRRRNYILSFIVFLLAIFCSFPAIATNPVANDDTFQAVEGIPVLLDVIANDFDADGDPLIVTVISPASNNCWGTSLNDLIINNGDGSLVFKTPTGITGSCTFNYRLENGDNPVTAQVKIMVTKIDDLLPVITEEPIASIVSLGDTAHFSITATGSEFLTYQWEKNGQALVDDARNSGTTEANLSITNVVLTDIGMYRCIVSNDFGEKVSDQVGLILDTDQVVQGPFEGTVISVPAIIQAEQYDFGATGTSHFDTTSGNSGTVFRTGDADLALGSNYTYFITDIGAGEWVEYTLSLPAAGDAYNLAFHYTSTGTEPGALQVEIPAEGAVHSIYLPVTPQGTWMTHLVSGIRLGAGTKTVRLNFTHPNFNLDYFEINQGLPPVAIRVTDPQDLGILAGNNYDVGSVVAGEVLEKTLTIHNDHASLDLHLSNFQLTGNGLSISLQAPATVAPQSSGDFRIQLFSNVPIGPTSGILSFASDGANRDGFSFPVSGQINTNLTNMIVEIATGDDGLTWDDVINGRTYFLQDDAELLGLRVTNDSDPTQGVPLNVSISKDNNAYQFFHGTSFTTVNPLKFTVGTGTGIFGSELFSVGLTNPDPQQSLQEVQIEITGNAPQSPVTFTIKKWDFEGGPLLIEDPKPELFGINGGVARANVIVSGGSGSYIYQWQKDDGSLPICCNYVNIDAGVPYHQGYNTSQLEISNLLTNPGTDVYKVIVYDATTYDPQNPGNAYAISEDRIHLIVYDTVGVTSEPLSQRVDIGSTATYQVIPEGGSSQFSYEWQYRPRGGAWSVLSIGAANTTVTSIAGGSQLEVINVTDANVGEYRCRVFQTDYPENETHSQPAYLSTLRISQHPRDVFTAGSPSYSVEAAAGGLPLSYSWLGQNSREEQGPLPLSIYPDHQEQYAGVSTRTLVHLDSRFGFEYFACEVSDGFATLKSLAAKSHGGSTGLVAADYFWHGNGQPLALQGAEFPFGGISWSADSALVQVSGKVFLAQGSVNEATATVPWLPNPQATNRVEIEMVFPNASGANDWIDFGFFNQTHPDLWARLFGDGQYEVYSGTDTLIGSGNSSIPSGPTYILEVDGLSRTFSLSRGSQNLLDNLALPNNFTSNFTRAGFRLRRAASPSDLAITLLRLRTLGHSALNDDVVFLNKSTHPSLVISPLRNDLGEFLSLSQGQSLQPEHGTANLNGSSLITYTPDPDWIGWDSFYYEVFSTTGFSGFAQIRIFTHDGPVLHAEPDVASVRKDMPQVVDVLANDVFIENGAVAISPTNPFPNLPANGEVIVNSDQTITYTPVQIASAID